MNYSVIADYLLSYLIISGISYVFSELLLVEAELWHQIRGSVILLLMKTSSVGFDIDAGVIPPPSLLSFTGTGFRSYLFTNFL